LSFSFIDKHVLIQHHKKLGILGSTGSIGCNTIKVIKNLNDNDYNIDVVFLTTNKRIDMLAEQVSVLKPQSVFIQDQKKAYEFISKYNFKDLEVLSGREDLTNLIRRDNYEMLLSSVVGFS
jgi:1-deoxy-D-xylulose-5-phosphate reductoisomerase